MSGYRVDRGWSAQASPGAWERDKRNRPSIGGPGIRDLPGGAALIEALVVTAVLAALATYAWHVLTPELFAEATAGGYQLSTAESGRLFGIEVWFAVVTAAAGLVAGAWLTMRHRLEPVLSQVMLTFTGVLGAVLVWQLGRATGPGDPAVRARVVGAGTELEMPLDVESYALLAIWPIAAIVAGAVVVAVRDRPAEARESE
ncbi:MAG TPA: hypothetical protein VFZ37_09840 [Jiangellaceae bacterium]